MTGVLQGSCGGVTTHYREGQHRQLHRVDGPAVVCTCGVTAWFLNDHVLSTDELKEHLKKMIVEMMVHMMFMRELPLRGSTAPQFSVGLVHPLHRFHQLREDCRLAGIELPPLE